MCNIEKKIERLTSDDKKEVLKQKLWAQLRKNGHGRRKKQKREERKRREKGMEMTKVRRMEGDCMAC